MGALLEEFVSVLSDVGTGGVDDDDDDNCLLMVVLMFRFIFWLVLAMELTKF